MDYSYSYATQSSSGTLDPGVTIAIIIGAIIFGLILYAIFAYIMGRIFKKAGEEPWKAWVPVYSSWVFLEIGGQKGWLALLALAGIIPFIGWIGSIIAFVFTCIAAYNIGLKLQKEGWFVVLYILVSPVWFIWLAFDSSSWQNTGASLATGTPPYQPPVATPTPPTEQPLQPVQPQPPISQPPVENPEQNQTPTPPTPPVAS